MATGPRYPATRNNGQGSSESRILGSLTGAFKNELRQRLVSHLRGLAEDHFLLRCRTQSQTQSDYQSREIPLIKFL